MVDRDTLVEAHRRDKLVGVYTLVDKLIDKLVGAQKLVETHRLDIFEQP